MSGVVVDGAAGSRSTAGATGSGLVRGASADGEPPRARAGGLPDDGRGLLVVAIGVTPLGFSAAGSFVLFVGATCIGAGNGNWVGVVVPACTSCVASVSIVVSITWRWRCRRVARDGAGQTGSGTESGGCADDCADDGATLSVALARVATTGVLLTGATIGSGPRAMVAGLRDPIPVAIPTRAGDADGVRDDSPPTVGVLTCGAAASIVCGAVVLLSPIAAGATGAGVLIGAALPFVGIPLAGVSLVGLYCTHGVGNRRRLVSAMMHNR